jgi:hypothetical protein
VSLLFDNFRALNCYAVSWIPLSIVLCFYLVNAKGLDRAACLAMINKFDGPNDTTTISIPRLDATGALVADTDNATGI